MDSNPSWPRIISVATCLVLLLLYTLSLHPPRPDDTSKLLLARSLDIQTFDANLTARANDRNDAIPGWTSPISTLLATPFDQLDTKGKAAVVGKGMACMLDQDLASTHAPQSKYTDPLDLERTRYGWSYSRNKLSDHDDADFLEKFGLSKAFDDLDISDDKNYWYQVSTAHSSQSTSNGKKYPATWGTYQSLFNLRDGTIVATQNYGPVWQNERDGLTIPADQVTPLRQWSDLVYLALQKTITDIGTGSIKGIKHVFRHNIVNDDVKEVMAMIAGKDDMYDYPSEWPGYSYPITENQALATLSTANGKGVAYFLSSHKSQMDIRVIDRANIFNCPGVAGGEFGAPQWCLYFHVVDKS